MGVPKFPLKTFGIGKTGVPETFFWGARPKGGFPWAWVKFGLNFLKVGWGFNTLGEILISPPPGVLGGVQRLSFALLGFGGSLGGRLPFFSPKKFPLFGGNFLGVKRKLDLAWAPLVWGIFARGFRILYHFGYNFVCNTLG